MSGPGSIQFTSHAEGVIAERRIEIEWIRRAVGNPELVERPGDGTEHRLRCIPEQSGRVLRVVLRLDSETPVVVTAFFDRRMKGRLP